MAQANDTPLALAIAYRRHYAGGALTPAAAKLYSQHCRLREGQDGLASWREHEPGERLDEALRLLDAALIERESGEGEHWRLACRRAGELLEWLSHPAISPVRVPTALLAAAAYQLAGYPARSAGLLRGDSREPVESNVLRRLLQGDFEGLTKALVEFWAAEERSTQESLPFENPDDLAIALEKLVIWETLSAAGIVVSQMRWGGERRADAALAKLRAITGILLHGEDRYSWLLAKLCSSVATVYFDSSMRRHLRELERNMSDAGRHVLERYVRQSYRAGKVLAWPSQIRGVERLASGDSFVLCAPTGSGKTAVAELAILQGLFPAHGDQRRLPNETPSGPLTMYLVPSRALAAEVEAKLSELVQRLAEPRVVVTGLYGGNDWGPTDAWLTRDDHVILICTYEKAEALIRFLGPLFVERVSLVVIDEAHLVQFDGNNADLQRAESRALRLEVLCARLLARASHARAVGLSAVAAGAEDELAGWLAGEQGRVPVHVDYRSTRQLIGRLECLPNRRFEIGYDLLDGASLEFPEQGSATRPFIPNPIPPYPPTPRWSNRASSSGPEKRLRPYLFWAAMQLASQLEAGRQRAVLISIPQQIGGYATDFLSLLESDWVDVDLPAFFQPPTEPNEEEMWNQCLEACDDYFGADSREYRLLRRGVVVHHGSMPGRLARLLVKVIQGRVVNLVMATSTLTEGLNLPFETVLIPTLRRWPQDLTPREFANLAGRAGRPGYGTEGRTLVLVSKHLRGDSPSTRESIRVARQRYDSMIESLQAGASGVEARSPLAELLLLLRLQWARVYGADDDSMYLGWLEETAPLAIDDGSHEQAIECLDTLDSILLSAIVELEEFAGSTLTLTELESELRRIWGRCYARYAAEDEARLEEAFLHRGVALVDRVYPHSDERRRLYRTSLPPRSGSRLLSVYPDFRGHLEAGVDYSRWGSEARCAFVETAVDLLSGIAQFKPADKAGAQEVDWRDILHWWLNPFDAPCVPSMTQVSNWHKYVRLNFQYRFNWGLGNVIAVAVDEAYVGEPRTPSIEDWPDTGLPWVALWLKELIVWGTLEPVAACLLALAAATTRARAELLARQYYRERTFEDSDELLNASTIRRWAEGLIRARSDTETGLPGAIPVELLRDFSGIPRQLWRVLPVEVDESITWLDPAGFPLARSPLPQHWRSDWVHSYDFQLSHATRTVLVARYLRFGP